MIRIFLSLAFVSVLAIAFVNCGGSDVAGYTPQNDIQETAQQLGDVMASIDELGGSDGGFAMINELKSADRMFARLQPERSHFSWLDQIIPNAVAATCGISTFGTCTGDAITRTFGGCTIGSATLDGTVTLSWVDGNAATTCAVDSNGDTITRVPSFTITGRTAGVLTVSKLPTSVGQVVTQTAANTFSFENDGIRRVITINSVDVWDYTTETTAPLTITGSARNGRILTSGGGAIRVTNNNTAVTCDYVPNNLTWDGTCNCPVSGSWTSTCSDGKTSSYTISACKYGTFTMGTDSQVVGLDRCLLLL